MDPKMLFCLPEGDALFNPLNTMFVQMACILVFSQLFYLFLKPCGQAGPVAQILAGIVLSLLTIIPTVHEFFLQKDSASYYIYFSFILRTLFMFLIGLEFDFDFTKRNLKNSIFITLGSLISSCIVWLGFLWFIVHFFQIKDDLLTLYLVYIVTLSNTASPVVIRSIIDWKLHTSEIGRLAVSCGLFIEVTNVALYTVVISYMSGTMVSDIFGYSLATGVIILINRFLASWLPKRTPKEKYISKAETLGFFIIILCIALTIESSNINSTVFVFFIGLLFPREGKTYRTLVQRLSYPIHEFVLPVYFGYIGFRFTVNSLTKRHFLVLGMTVALSMLAKLLGVLFACSFLNIPKKYWLFLSTILSAKGHMGLVLLDSNVMHKKWFTSIIHDIFVAALVIITLLSGVISSLLLRAQEKGFSHQKTSLEYRETTEELRVLTCVYGVRQTRGLISLLSALTGDSSSPFTPYLMHLIPLSKKRKNELLYHELDDEGVNSSGGGADEFGFNEGLEINESIDSYTKEKKIMIRQVKLVAQMENMHEEICDGSEELRVSIVFLPFHKHQRIDGKTTNDGEMFRDINRNVLKHALCSVGIFVDRNMTGFHKLNGSDSVQHVAALFFGGPDDREALSLCKWLVNNSKIHLTVIQFVADEAKTEKLVGDPVTKEKEVFMEIVGKDETEKEIDRTFLQEFYSRFVTTGQVGYIEKRVSNGMQTLMNLREIGEMYSLFAVGMNRGDCAMTAGMNDWEECPELGTVGDFLASSSLDVNASVLVVQRHRHSFDSFVDE